jgi:hypothetical protein
MGMTNEKIEKFLKSGAINSSHFARKAFPKNHVSILHGRLNNHRGKLLDHHFDELRPLIIDFLNEFA